MPFPGCRRGKAVVLLLAIIFCPVAGLAAAIDAEAKYRSDLEEGVSLLRSGSRDDISRAIARFKSALKVRQDSAEAYYWIALAYSDQNNYPRAAENSKDATIYDERLTEAWLLWGQTLLYQKDWPGALEKLETAERLAPNDPLVLFNLGRVYYHGLANPGSAYAKFNRVWQNGQELRRENPENAVLVLNARLYMGYCEFDRGQWTNAINAFQDVLREDPDNRAAALRLAIAYRKADRVGDCERILHDLLRAAQADIQPNRHLLAEINLQLADLYMKEPAMRNRMFVLNHLREFINNTDNLNHPAMDAAREYLMKNELVEE